MAKRETSARFQGINFEPGIPKSFGKRAPLALIEIACPFRQQAYLDLNSCVPVLHPCEMVVEQEKETTLRFAATGSAEGQFISLKGTSSSPEGEEAER